MPLLSFCLSLGLFLWFSSLKVWVPLSRLSFSIGMLQFIAIEYLYASIRVAANFDLLSMAITYVVGVLFTFVLANVVFVVMEGPLMALLKKYSDFKRRAGLEPKLECNGLSKKVE